MQQITSIAAPEATLTDDERAIIAVTRAETQAFIDDDFPAWQSVWVQADRARMISVTPTTGLDVQTGWTAIADEMKDVMDNGLGCDMVRFESRNFQIEISNDVAWVVYDQWAENRSGATWGTLETRFLERTAEGWKIVYCAFIDQGRDTSGQGVLAVDAKGRVVSARPEISQRLKDHPFLTISAGRVRARRTEWDRVLQAAIAEAGRHHGFYLLRRFEDETGGPFHFPAVLGETDDGGIAVVHILVRDSTTYIQFDGARVIERRLSVAQAVFGLSDGQTRVARHIADGLGPKGAAEALGITVNTARTHLTRLYEKTGVNSQAALVRILLSVS